MSSHPVTQFTNIDSLTYPEALESLLGPVESVSKSRLKTNGYSGSTHDRLKVSLGNGEQVNLMLKRTRRSQDWTAYRTGDTTGREAMLLGTPALAGVWDVFACPYRAYACQDGEVGLLMDDLSDHLFSEMDEPISIEQEDALLSTLAEFHARYWSSEVLQLPWLVRPSTSFGMLGPGSAAEELLRPTPHPLFRYVRRGWRSALERLPASMVNLLTASPQDLARYCDGLPWTLLHGDVRIANFATLPDGRVSVFDWECVGAGPSTLDIGWYLAVNAGRLARSKKDAIAFYRRVLETKLGDSISNEVWDRMVRVGVLCGAVMFLWGRALALDSGTAYAQADWDWWVEQISQLR